MMAFLVWTFISFWRYVGVIVLLSASFQGVAAVVSAFRSRAIRSDELEALLKAVSRAPRELGEE